MRTFGIRGTYTPGAGVYGLGTTTGSPFERSTITTLLAVVDPLHPPPGHNGTDFAPEGSVDLYEGTGGIVMRNFANIWVGPGPKVLYSYDDQWGHHEKVVQPGELDRGGNELWVYHPGPWRLLDGSVSPAAVTRHCHLESLPPLAPFTEIKAGDWIGRAGTTGVSTGVHDHFALQFQQGDGVFPRDWDSDLTDPLPYFGRPIVEDGVLPGGEFLPVDAPTVEGEIAPSGLSLVTITGTLAQLDTLTGTVSALVGGTFVTYIPGAPAFVNATFIAAFPQGLARTPAVVICGG